MKKLDTYLGLCTEVYDLSKPNPPEDAYAFYRDYVMRSTGSVLEPMCGKDCEYIFLSDEGGDDRMQYFEHLQPVFLPNGAIDRAYQSYKTREIL